MNWLGTIERRKSIRQYQQSLDEGTLARLRFTLNQPRVLFDQPLRLALVDGSDVHPLLKGFIGSYGKVLAPWYIVLLAGDSKESIQNLGYAGEHIVLELTAQGLGTCWLGGYFDKAYANALVGASGEEQVHALIALGHPGKQTWNRLIKSTNNRRQPLHKRVEAQDLDNWLLNNPRWYPVLEAVRWAPSALNRQPWRVLLKPDCVHIYSVPAPLARLGKLTSLDIGIALCHLQLAAGQMGIKGTLIKDQQPPKTRWQYELTFRYED